MRFNYKSYPVLASLEGRNALHLPIDEFYSTQLRSPEEILQVCESAIEVFHTGNERYYMTESFMSAIEQAAPKIVADNKHIEHEKNDAATFFHKDGVLCFISNPADKAAKFICYGFNKECLTSLCIIMHNGTAYGYFPVKDQSSGIVYNNTSNLLSWGHSMMVAAYFLRNCEVETLVVKPQQKVKHGADKHLNETAKNITLLDCRWFTEMIRDIPFGVKGHFRWQPHGPKNAKRKLIWIADFEKKGYHRKAGVQQ